MLYMAFTKIIYGLFEELDELSEAILKELEKDPYLSTLKNMRKHVKTITNVYI